MKASASLRRRMAAGIAVLVTLVVAVHSVALYLIIEDREEEQIDRLVSEEMEAFVARYRASPEAPRPHSRYLTAYVARNDGERAALPSYLRDLAVGDHEIYVEGEELHVAMRTLGATRLYVSYDASHHEAQLRELVWLLGFSVVVTGVAASVLGFMLARFLTGPVADLARRVAALGPGQPAAEPLSTAYRDDEVRRLAAAFDAYAERMAGFVAREQAFTADVSHELRTPLTAIRTGCELLLARNRLSADARARVERIARAAERMGEVIRSLLVLARAGQPAEAEVVSLHACAEDVAEPLREELAARGVVLRNDIPAEATACLDRTALCVVLSNLLRNAADGTDAGHIVWRLRDRELELEDSGRGIAAEDVPHIFERHYRGRGARGAEGYGIGLALVKRITERNGWKLALDSEPGRGTRVRLALPS